MRWENLMLKHALQAPKVNVLDANAVEQRTQWCTSYLVFTISFHSSATTVCRPLSVRKIKTQCTSSVAKRCFDTI